MEHSLVRDQRPLRWTTDPRHAMHARWSDTRSAREARATPQGCAHRAGATHAHGCISHMRNLGRARTHGECVRQRRAAFVHARSREHACARPCMRTCTQNNANAQSRSHVHDHSACASAHYRTRAPTTTQRRSLLVLLRSVSALVLAAELKRWTLAAPLAPMQRVCCASARLTLVCAPSGVQTTSERGAKGARAAMRRNR